MTSLTGLGNFAKKWQRSDKNWFWKSINKSDNFKKDVIFQWVMFSISSPTGVQ